MPRGYFQNTSCGEGGRGWKYPTDSSLDKSNLWKRKKVLALDRAQCSGAPTDPSPKIGHPRKVQKVRQNEDEMLANASICGLGENQVKRQNMFQWQESRTSRYIAHNHWIIHFHSLIQLILDYASYEAGIYLGRWWGTQLRLFLHEADCLGNNSDIHKELNKSTKRSSERISRNRNQN